MKTLMAMTYWLFSAAGTEEALFLFNPHKHKLHCFLQSSLAMAFFSIVSVSMTSCGPKILDIKFQK